MLPVSGLAGFDRSESYGPSRTAWAVRPESYRKTCVDWPLSLLPVL